MVCLGLQRRAPRELCRTEPAGFRGVVLANKIPLAADWNAARAFFEYPHLRYECTVGAGLPVIDTLHYLLNTGDRVTKIKGCLSGTLGF